MKSLYKNINLMYSIHRLEEERYMIISIGIEKECDKINTLYNSNKTQTFS